MSWFWIYVIIEWTIRLAMIPVVLRRSFAPGAAIAWLGIVFLHPYVGLTLYALIGESRLDRTRVRRHREMATIVSERREQIAQQGHAALQPELHPSYEPMALQAEKISGLPILGGNEIELLPDAAKMAERLIGDIDAATTSAHLLYYIFAPDPTGDRVLAALVRAAQRGVRCRLLVDGLASREFLRSRARKMDLARAGVELAAALPVAPIRRRLARMDLRNHRKLAIIDQRVGYCGSHNLINADYGGRRGAPWVDLTCRYTGPVVAELALVFAEDWAIESGATLNLPAADADLLSSPTGAISAQAVPTGPADVTETYRRVLLAAVQCARHRLILTTPYFVPDEATLISLQMAVDRGVKVSLILPRVPDHLFTAAAGRAHFTTLLGSGVSIHLYRPGLIHAKTISVDDALAIVGSANLDVRSFNLNFELSMLLYGADATDRLREIQQRWLDDSDTLDLATWSKRSALRKYADRAISLLSPLL